MWLPRLPQWPTWAYRALTDLQVDVAAMRRDLLELPTLIERKIRMSLENLQAAVERNGSAVAQAVSGITDLRGKIATLQEKVNAGDLDQTQIAAITASLDASTDAIAQALSPVVEDPEVPTGEVEAPPAENPDTAPPTDVEGAVPAGEPLQV